MIRTLILAAILVVLVVIARTSPDALPEAARTAGPAIEQQVRKAVSTAMTAVTETPVVASHPAVTTDARTVAAPDAGQPRQAAVAPPAESAAVPPKAPASPLPTAEPRPQAAPFEDLPAVEVKKRNIATPKDLPLPPAGRDRSASDGVSDSRAGAGHGRTAESAPKFMTPRERSRELHRIARDMEAMFADKAVR